jgi:hypothetical protein
MIQISLPDDVEIDKDGKALIVYLAGNSNKNMVSVYPNPTV